MGERKFRNDGEKVSELGQPVALLCWLLVRREGIRIVCKESERRRRVV